MNMKKWVVTLCAVLVSTVVFAQTVPQGQGQPLQPNQMDQFLQQYQAEQARLNKQFEEKLLSPIKTLVDAVLVISKSGQEELTQAQEKELEAYSNNLEAALNALVAPVVRDLDIAQLNVQYQDMMRQMGVTNAPDLTRETVTELFKGMYLIGALTYFEQTNKLTAEELEVSMALFMPQPEEEEEAPVQ